MQCLQINSKQIDEIRVLIRDKKKLRLQEIMQTIRTTGCDCTTKFEVNYRCVKLASIFQQGESVT